MADLPNIALSIRQPWAWLIVNGFKDIENRNWPTRVRGPVLIHAAKGMTKQEWEDCFFTCREIAESHPFPIGTVFPAFNELERGGIIGMATIAGCVDKSNSPWFFGRYGFVLTGTKPLPFQACKGQLGFFKPDMEGSNG